MCIKEELFTSFIKGLGKTSGTITIFGFLGAAWYLYNKSTNYSLTKDINKVFENEEIILQETEKSEESEESDEVGQQTTIQESVLEKDKLKISNNNKSQNFRKIFDNL